MGAMLGTSYGIYRGQAPGQALLMALGATVIAVAVDEVIKENEQKQM